MTDRTEIVPDIENDPPAILTQPVLVRCLTCGYHIPHQLGSKCPECAAIWYQSCDLRLQFRNSVLDDFATHLKATIVGWFIILAIFAFGAFGASQGSWESLLFVFFGVGFGIVASLGIGIGLCKLGPSHQFKLHADIWTKKLWWLHAPWLLIAPLTIIGSLISLSFRVLDPSIGEEIMFGVVLIELIAWALLSLAAGIIWLVKYGEARTQLGITNANSVVTLHIIYAILIWIGSGMVGFFGGMLGTFFMIYLLGDSMMDF